jgi:hypothetical protein
VSRNWGFDWVSVSEHHYSPRILTPSLPIAAAYIASHVAVQFDLGFAVPMLVGTCICALSEKTQSQGYKTTPRSLP